MTRRDVRTALRVDADEWRDELPQITEWFEKFGDKLPGVLWAELDALARPPGRRAAALRVGPFVRRAHLPGQHRIIDDDGRRDHGPAAVRRPRPDLLLATTAAATVAVELLNWWYAPERGFGLAVRTGWALLRTFGFLMLIWHVRRGRAGAARSG